MIKNTRNRDRALALAGMLALHHSDAVVRRRIVHYLDWFGAEAKPILLKALKDKNRLVRNDAAESLAVLEKKRQK